MNVKKVFILDTNVLLYDARAMFNLGSECEVVIPIPVIEELDRFKKGSDETARNSREVLRILDRLRKKGSLSKGVLSDDEKQIIRIDLCAEKETALPDPLISAKADNLILGVAATYRKKLGKKKVVFITKDTNLRIKADALDIRAGDYEPTSLRIEEFYTGKKEIELSKFQMEKFVSNGEITLGSGKDLELYSNQYLVVKEKGDESEKFFLGRFDEQFKRIVQVTDNYDVWGIKSKNIEQSFAFDALLDENIKLVTLVGKAGTGKTLLAIAAGLQKTIDDGCHKRVLASRPIIPMGRDMGYLPGDVVDKLNPWMQPIYDNLEHILSASGEVSSKKGERSYEELIHQGMVSVEPLTYIRGRSIANQYLIVDEAQNLTPHEIKTIITRAGYKTKVVLTGDPYQIDNPYVDSVSNGLSFVVERFKTYSIHAHISLIKGERSKLSELAAELLER